MTTTTISVIGTLQPDEITLQLDRKIDLQPGLVTVIVQSTASQSGFTALEALEHIHREQQLRGYKPMTEQEMVAEIAEMRSGTPSLFPKWNSF